MKLLIIGGTGNISREITRQAVEAGFDVTIFNRGTRADANTPKGVKVITGDRKVPGELKQKLRGLEFDAVIDMICYGAEDARTTMSIFDGRAQQVIFTSSVAAYEHPVRTLPVTERNIVLRTDPTFTYGFEKANMERFLTTMEKKSAITIIRPSLTFGVGCKNLGVMRQNANIARRIAAGKPLVMFGDGTALWTFTFAPDMGSAYVKSLLRPSTYDRAFHVTSGHINIFEELYTTVGDIMGRKPEIVHAATDLLCSFDKDLFNHIALEKKYGAVFDCSSFREAVPDWEPRYDLRAGMEMIYSWWESEGFPYEKEKDELEDRICSRIRSLNA